MTKALTGWAAVLLNLAVLSILTGCGSDKDAPVYDTAANPHGLPAQACEMLDAIEAGQMVSYDVITESFGRLYLENQELLENKHWKEIITRLGGKFRHRADDLIKKGVQQYTQAAGFYILASFSAPNDTKLAEKAALFSSWKVVMEKIDNDYIPSPTSGALTDRLDFLRYFVLGDSLERAFAEEYLVHQLLDSLMSSPGAVDRQSLSRADAALLSYLEIADSPNGEPLSLLEDPPVHLMATRLVAIGQQRVRAELYFRATEAFGEDLYVTISIDSVGEDTSDRSNAKGQYIYFEPIKPTSGWAPGQLQPAAVEFTYGHGTAWQKYTFSRAIEDDPDSVVFEIVSPPAAAKEPLTVERFYQR